MEQTTKSETSVQSLWRTLDIIEHLSLRPAGMTLTDLAVDLGLHKSTVHRLLSTLMERGYVEQALERGCYRLGLKFLELSSMRLRHLELKTEALPQLRRLAELVGQAVHLAILSGNEAVYIEKIEPVASLRLYSQIGKRIPLYCSALGKALLFDEDDARLDEILATQSFKPFTCMTKTDASSLAVEIRRARTLGWSVDDEEHEAGIRCIASPLRDYRGSIAAALSVSGDKKTISADKDAEHGQLVRHTAHEISKRLGWIAESTDQPG